MDGQQRNKRDFVFRPQGDEQSLGFWSRARFAMLGAHGVTAITPESHPQLASMLEQVSDKAGMPPPRAYIWHSRKPVANAVAMPAAKPTIAFSEKILELLDPQELAAVTGHELGHVKNMGHSGTLFWLAAFGGLAIGETIGRPLQRAIRGKMQDGNRNPLLGVADLTVMTGRFLSPAIAGAVAGRSEEYAADRFGAYMMEGDGVPLLSGLQKLGEYNQQNFRPTLVGKILKPVIHLTRSHPKFEQRREALGITPQAINDYRAAQEPQPEAVPQQPQPQPQPVQEGMHTRAVQERRGTPEAGQAADGSWQSRHHETAEHPQQGASR